jgi:hypothetical protein
MTLDPGIFLLSIRLEGFLPGLSTTSFDIRFRGVSPNKCDGPCATALGCMKWETWTIYKYSPSSRVS